MLPYSSVTVRGASRPVAPAANGLVESFVRVTYVKGDVANGIAVFP